MRQWCSYAQLTDSFAEHHLHVVAVYHSYNTHVVTTPGTLTMGSVSQGTSLWATLAVLLMVIHPAMLKKEDVQTAEMKPSVKSVHCSHHLCSCSIF